MGLADVDAVTLSMARLAPELLRLRSPLSPSWARCLATRSASSPWRSLGRGLFAREVAAMSAACIVAGGLALGLALTFA